MSEADLRAFGTNKARSNIVRNAYVIVSALLGLVVVASALGTFIETFRHLGAIYHVMIIAEVIAGVAGFILLLVISSTRLRKKKPLNIILLLVDMALFAVSAFATSCYAEVGVVFGVTLTPIIFMLIVIVISFCGVLDCSRVYIYLISGGVVMGLNIAIYVRYYVSEDLHWAWMVFAPILSILFCVAITFNTMWSIQKEVVENTKLSEDDYVQEAVYVFVGRHPVCCSCCNDCCCCDCEYLD